MDSFVSPSILLLFTYIHIDSEYLSIMFSFYDYLNFQFFQGEKDGDLWEVSLILLNYPEEKYFTSLTLIFFKQQLFVCCYQHDELPRGGLKERIKVWKHM